MITVPGLSSIASFEKFVKKKGGKILVAIIVFVILFFAGRKYLEKRKKQKEIKDFNKNEGTDLNSLAMRYKAAANPSGIESLINWDSTKTDIILPQLAEQTKGNLPLVSSQYKKIDPDNLSLSERMEKELSAEDFGTWSAIVN